MHLRPPLKARIVAGEKLEYLLVSTVDPQLKGEICLSIIGSDGAKYSATSMARLEQGSALFVDSAVPHFHRIGSCWLRAEYVPSVDCSDNGACCLCFHSRLIFVTSERPCKLSICPVARIICSDGTSVINEFRLSASVGRIVDTFGNTTTGSEEILFK